MPERYESDSVIARWRRRQEVREEAALLTWTGGPDPEPVDHALAPETVSVLDAVYAPEEPPETPAAPEPAPSPAPEPETPQEGAETPSGPDLSRVPWVMRQQAAVAAGVVQAGRGVVEGVMGLFGRDPAEPHWSTGAFRAVEELLDGFTDEDAFATGLLKEAGRFGGGWMMGGRVLQGVKALGRSIQSWQAAGKAAERANAWSKGMLAGTGKGALADFLSITHDTPLLSEVLSDQFPELEPYLPDFLEVRDPDVLEHKLKAAVEGGAIGSAAELAVRGVASAWRLAAREGGALARTIEEGTPLQVSRVDAKLREIDETLNAEREAAAVAEDAAADAERAASRERLEAVNREIEGLNRELDALPSRPVPSPEETMQLRREGAFRSALRDAPEAGVEPVRSLDQWSVEDGIRFRQAVDPAGTRHGARLSDLRKGENGHAYADFAVGDRTLTLRVDGYHAQTGLYTFREFGDEAGRVVVFDRAQPPGAPTAEYVEVPQAMRDAHGDDSIQPLHTTDGPRALPDDVLEEVRKFRDLQGPDYGWGRWSDRAFSALVESGDAVNVDGINFMRLGDEVFLRDPDDSGRVIRTGLDGSHLSGGKPSAKLLRGAAQMGADVGRDTLVEAGGRALRRARDQERAAVSKRRDAFAERQEQIRIARSTATRYAFDGDETLILNDVSAGGRPLVNKRLSRMGARDWQDTDGGHPNRKAHIAQWNEERMAQRVQEPVDYDRFTDGPESIGLELDQRADAVARAAGADAGEAAELGAAHAKNTRALARFTGLDQEAIERMGWYRNTAASDSAVTTLSESAHQVKGLARKRDYEALGRAVAGHQAILRTLAGDPAGAERARLLVAQGMDWDEARYAAEALETITDEETLHAWFRYHGPDGVAETAPTKPVNTGRLQGVAEEVNPLSARSYEQIESARMADPQYSAKVVNGARSLAQRALTSRNADDLSGAAEALYRAAAARSGVMDGKHLLKQAELPDPSNTSGLFQALRALSDANTVPDAMQVVDGWARAHRFDRGPIVPRKAAPGADAPAPAKPAVKPPAEAGTADLDVGAPAPKRGERPTLSEQRRQEWTRKAQTLHLQGLFGVKTNIDIGLSSALIVGTRPIAGYLKGAADFIAGETAEAARRWRQTNFAARESYAELGQFWRAAKIGYRGRAMYETEVAERGFEAVRQRFYADFRDVQRIDTLDDAMSGRAAEAKVAADAALNLNPKWAIVTNVMSALDMGFRASFARGRLAERALSRAEDAGYSGNAALARAREYMAAPSKADYEDSFDYANEMAFMQKVENGRLNQNRYDQAFNAIQEALSKNLLGATARVLFFPVMKTPYLMMRFAVESFAGRAGARALGDWHPSSKRFINRLNGLEGKPAKELARARLYTARAFLGAAFMLADEDLITGGHVHLSDRDQRAKWSTNTGRPEYSIRVGDAWMDYTRIPVFGAILGLVADTRTILWSMDEGQAAGWEGHNVLMGVMVTLANFTTNNTFARNLGDMLSLVGGLGSEGGAARFVGHVGRQAANFIPYKKSLLEVQDLFGDGGRTLNRPFALDADGQAQLDSWQRELNRVRQSIPLLSPDLPNDVDVDGQPMDLRAVYGTGAFARFGKALLPYRLIENSADPIHQDYHRLSHYPLPPKGHLFGGEVALDPVEHVRLKTLWGQRRRALEEDLALTPGWMALSDDQQRERLRAASFEATRWAREVMQAETVFQMRHAESRDALAYDNRRLAELVPEMQRMMEE